MFDARSAKLLTPGAHLTIPEAPGLRLVATKTTRSWVYRYKSPVDGLMRQVKLGSWPVMPFQSAWVEWEKLRQAREAGADPAMAKRAEKTNKIIEARATDVKNRRARYTVQQACDDYLAAIEKTRTEKGWKEVRRMFRTMLRDLPSLPAAAVSRGDAYGLIESWSHIPVQATRLRGELGGAWDRAIDSGQLPGETPNWWRVVLRGKLKSKGRASAATNGKPGGVVKRVLSDAELGEVIRWLPNFPRSTQDALVLYMWTATRGAEIVSMHASEIAEEADGWWWTVPKAKTKNADHPLATDLRVPLIGRALFVVKRRLAVAQGGYLFPSRTKRGHIEQKAVSLSVWSHQPYSETKPEYIRARMDVTNWAPHDLRRTSRTLLAAMRCPQEVAEAVLGHVQPGVVGVYNRHGYDAEKRHWLTLLDERLEELAGTIPQGWRPPIG